MTIVSALLLGLVKLSASPRPLRIDIVFDGPPMAARLEATAIAEAARIWAAYGVDVEASNPTEAGRDDAIRLDVRFADHPDSSIARDALGSIHFFDETPDPAVVMYPNAIADLVSGVRLAGLGYHAWPPALRDLILGRVLGRALAHEIGHFLLRSRGHSAHGLMRARQPVSDLVGLERDGFVLSAGDVTRLVSVRSASLH